MIPNPFPGKFFAFEGIDGCGKTEQLRRANDWLTNTKQTPHRNYAVRSEKEPGKNRFWGAAIYKELLKPDGLHTTNLYGFQSWYARDSKDHMGKETIRNLDAGCVVLMDRYRHSMVFGVPATVQSLDGRIEAIKSLMQLNQAISGEDFIWPDAALIFDVSIETAIARLKKKFQESGRGDFDEHERFEKLKTVRQNYLLLPRMYPNCHIIDAEGSPEEVFEKVQSIIGPIISKTGSV